MAGMFDRYDDLCNNVEEAYQALVYCITHDVCVSGRCIQWLVEEHEELIYDWYYDDFEDSSRWSIGKAYILFLEGGFYRCWEELGLTEMQPNEWFDQTCERVHMGARTISVWLPEEEDN